MSVDGSTETALEDIKKRSYKILAFICETEDGKLQIISYDANGCVEYISRRVNSIDFMEPGEGNLTSLIGSLSNNK